MPWIRAGTSLDGMGIALIGEDVLEGWYGAGREWASLYRLSLLWVNLSVMPLHMVVIKEFCKYMLLEALRKSMDVLIRKVSRRRWDML